MQQHIHIGPIRIRRRLAIRSAILLLVLAFLFLGRNRILRAIGHHLIVQDPVEQVDALFVLSGNSFDRGREAARLYKAGHAPTVVCLGGEPNPALELYGIHDLTGQMTQGVLREEGVPNSAIELLPEGTSTFEEFQAIVERCHARGWKTVMVVSSLFHTRRIHEFFRLRLHFEGIRMVLRGSAESAFSEDEWWKREPGLIFVANEYIKRLYYWLRY